MHDLHTLITQRDAAHAKAKGILAKAEAEKDAEGLQRDLTEEESKEFNESVALRDKLSKQLQLRQSVDAFDSQLTTPPTLKRQPENPNDENREFAKPKARGTLKYMKGADAIERAHRAGRFYLACMGHANSRRWCERNGIAIQFVADRGEREIRLHQENVNTTGGYLVPDEVDADLIDLREQFGVFRRFARRSPMSSDTKSRRRRTGGLTAYFVGEAAQGTESTKSWDTVSLTAKKLMILSTITNELREDAVVDIGDDLSGEIAYAFAEKEDDCGFNGDGTSTYGGIVGVRNALRNLSATRADISGLFVGADNVWSGLLLTDFEQVTARLPVYADTPNVRWFAHKKFFHTVMLRLELAAGGNTAANIAAGQGPTFLGYPVEFVQKMPKAEADDQVCALLGDLRLAADFGDRRLTTIMFSEHATVGGVSVFEYDEMAVRGTERFDINVHDVGDQNATAASQNPGPVVGLLTAAS